MDYDFEYDLDYQDIDTEVRFIKGQSSPVQDIYDTLCLIENYIINKQIDLDDLYEMIKDAIIQFQVIRQMPKCILIKIMQTFYLLLQFNNTRLDYMIKQFQQFVQQYEEEFKQINLISETENYQISKAFIYDYEKEFKYIALSPNEKYLLVGSSRQVYLYDITTKLNIKKYKKITYFGLFSSNSKKIILKTFQRILIININTNKECSYINKHSIQRAGCFPNKNYLYLCSIDFWGDFLRIMKIDLRLNHKIFQFSTPYDINFRVQVFEDLITLKSLNYLKLLNEKSRKPKLTIKFSDYKIKNLFYIAKNKMLSTNQESELIIWNIDYGNNSLIKQKVLPFSAYRAIRGNPIFQCIYLISYDKFLIIDENYHSIQIDNCFKLQQYDFHENCYQINTDRIFVIFQKDGVYILERYKKS